MRVAFVRTAGKPDRMYVHRSDGTEVSWSFPTYGDELPHDLVHLVVEAGFGVTDGIYAHVNQGVDLARANAQANRAGGKRKHAGTGLDAPSVYLSEALAAARWSDKAATDGDRLDTITKGCEAYGVAIPAAVTLARIAEVRAVLDALRTRWRALLPKGAIDLDFDVRAPAESFAAFSDVNAR